MISFKNDYSEIAHKNILDLLYKASNEQNNGYGLDDHSMKAKALIKYHLKKENVDIHFLTGGTSCNKIAISHILRPHQAVISVASGHINVHETGAIEATGHKVLTVKGVNGKITRDEIIDIVRSHTDEHMVMPKMVYISNSTEIGTIYKKNELEEIYSICKELGLYLYLDGARLGVALTSNENDLTLEDIANLTDIFYIGGTKNGAMLGEALVIINEDIKEDFRYSIKLNGGMLAKGFVVGIQFEALFSNNLFFDLAKSTNEKAMLLKNGLQKLGIELEFDSPTNQQFLILDDNVVEQLKKNYKFEIWEKQRNKTIIRLVTSWATTSEAVTTLLDDLVILLKNKK